MQLPPMASRWRHQVSFNDSIIFFFILFLLFKMWGGFFFKLHPTQSAGSLFYCVRFFFIIIIVVLLDKTRFRISGARQLSPKYLNSPASFQMCSIPPWLTSTFSNKHISSSDCVKCTFHISGNGKNSEIIFSVYVFVSLSFVLFFFFNLWKNDTPSQYMYVIVHESGLPYFTTWWQCSSGHPNLLTW